MRYLIPLLLLLSSCASSYPKRYRSHACGIRMIVASAEQVDKHCRKIVKKDDHGVTLTEGHRIKACIGKRFRGLRTVFLIEGEEKSLIHEMCHLDGLTKEECAEIH